MLALARQRARRRDPGALAGTREGAVGGLSTSGSPEPGTTATSSVDEVGPSSVPSVGVTMQRQRSPSFTSRGGTSCELSAKDCAVPLRSEEHTSELQSQFHLVCRLLLEK